SGLGRLLNSALAGFDPDSISGTNPVTGWLNRKYGGPAYDLDTVVGTDANLSTLDSGVALLPGAAGDNLSTPSAPANRITGDIDIRTLVALFDYTPAANNTLIAKAQDTNNRSYWLEVGNTAALKLVHSPDGTSGNQIVTSSTIATGIAAGTVIWFRATMDVDDGAGNHVVIFYTSTDDVADSADVTTWTQLGATVTIVGTTSIYDSASPVEIGGLFLGSIQVSAGKVYRAQIFNGIDGTLVVDFNPSDADAGVAIDTDTWTSSTTGEVWTVNGDAFVNNTGHTGIYSRGSVGLETTSGQLINSPVTVYAVFKPTLAAPGANQVLFDARLNAGNRIVVRTNDANSDKYSIFQGGTTLEMSPAYDNELRVITSQFNGDATTKLTVSDVGSVTGDAGSGNWDFGSVLIKLDGTLTFPGLFLELLVFDSAHNSGEISRIQNFLAAKYST
ncbi:hypothetical protein LCGC14_0470820, partial [marine sediment metagenome]